MAIELSPKLQAEIQEQVDAGDFPNVEAVVQAGMAMIKERREQIETLRALLATAEADLAAGRTIPFDEAFRRGAHERVSRRIQNGEQLESDAWP